MGEEAATPGEPVARLRAFSGFAPRQFTLENHRLPLALPQSFGKLRNLHVSLSTLSAKSLRLRNTKTLHGCAETVEDDISLWKAEEKQELILPVDSCSRTISITCKS